MKSLAILLLCLMVATPLVGSESGQLTSGDKVPFTSVKDLGSKSDYRAIRKHHRPGKRLCSKSRCCVSNKEAASIGCLSCIGLATKCLTVNYCPLWLAACL